MGDHGTLCKGEKVREYDAGVEGRASTKRYRRHTNTPCVCVCRRCKYSALVLLQVNEVFRVQGAVLVWLRAKSSVGCLLFGSVPDFLLAVVNVVSNLLLTRMSHL